MEINTRYQQKENESYEEYAMRLVDILKTERPEDLEWDDIKLYLKFDGNKDSLRKANDTSIGGYAIYKYFKDKQARQNISDDKILGEYEVKKRELLKEKQKFFDERTSYKKMIREEARWEEVNDILKRTIQSGCLPDLDHEYRTFEHTDNDLLVSLNDLHYGADIDNAWNNYNSDICKERLDYYINKILQIKELHNSENCVVTANGDLINGNIHRSVLVSNRENIIEQVMGVSELISQFLAELSEYFNQVIFVEVAGNHSRLGKKEDSLKNERLDDIAPWYIKARLQNIDNISFVDNIDNTMAIVDIRGKKYLCLHGDYDRGQSAKKSCALMTRKNVYAICCGHLHHNSMDYVDGMKVIMAGSFLGIDDYCITNRIIGVPQQLVCVCDDTGVVCSYDVNFTPKKG